MVNGYFAKAAITIKDYSTFTNEFNAETHLALDEDKGNYDFREIYNPYSGKPDGGWQASGSPALHHWDSCKLQTWSATAYISMILNGLIGLQFNENSLALAPYLPQDTGYIKLNGLAYRKSVLDITVKGKGKIIKTFMIDGKVSKNHFIASALTGKHSISVELK